MGVNRYRAAIVYVIFDRHVSVSRLFYLNINYLVKLNFFSWRIFVILGFLGSNFYTLLVICLTLQFYTLLEDGCDRERLCINPQDDKFQIYLFMNNQIYHLVLQRFSCVPTRCVKINSRALINFISTDFKGNLVNIFTQDRVKIFVMIILIVLARSKK